MNDSETQPTAPAALRQAQDGPGQTGKGDPERSRGAAPLAPFLAVGAGLAVCLALLSLRLVSSGDPFCHLAVGRWIAEHHAAPRVNLFMYTAPDFPWINHSWLFELLLFGVYRLGGIAGTQVLVLLAVLGVFAILLRFWRRMGVSPALAPVPFLVAMVAMAPRFRPRPELATWVLLAVTLALLFQWRRRPGRAIWALPAMGAVWANLHGGMAAGLLACFLVTASEGLQTLAARRFAPFGALAPRTWAVLALATAATAASALLTPYGLDWYRSVAPGRLAFLSEFIREWRPLFGLADEVGAPLPVLVALLALLVGSFFVSRGFDLTAAALMLAFGALTLQSQRNLALLALVSLVVIAANLHRARWPAAGADRRRWEPVFWIAGAACGLAVVGLALNLSPFNRLANVRRLGLGIDAKVLPVAAARWVRSERLPGRLFNAYRYGGYLIWTDPEHSGRPLFMDGLNAYGVETMKEYLEAYWARPRAEAVLDRWEINTCLLPDTPIVPLREEGDLRPFLLDSPEWLLVFRDGVAVVFVRAAPKGDARRPALP